MMNGSIIVADTRRLLAGQQTQLRRPISPSKVRFFDGSGRSWRPSTEYLAKALEDAADFRYVAEDVWTWMAKAFPHQQAERTRWMAHVGVAPGTRLWVREMFRLGKGYDGAKPDDAPSFATVWYEATGENSPVAGTPITAAGQKRAATHMPRWASRLTLIVTDVRVQRLHEISEADALAEGVTQRDGGFVVLGVEHPNKDFPVLSRGTAREMYAALWDVINGAGSWLTNPWVVAVTFTVQHRNIDSAALTGSIDQPRLRQQGAK